MIELLFELLKRVVLHVKSINSVQGNAGSRTPQQHLKVTIRRHTLTIVRVASGLAK